MVSASVCAIVAALPIPSGLVAVYCVSGVIATGLGVIDLRVRRLPYVLTGVMYGSCAVAFLVRTGTTGDGRPLVRALTAGAVAFLTFLNCLGVQEGKWTQNIFTVAKTLALALLIVLGLTVAANPKAIEANTSDLWAGAWETKRVHDIGKIVPVGGLAIVLMVAGGSMVGSLFSADAWNNVTFTAGEVKNPRRNLPLSLALGTGLVIVLYMLANIA